MALRSRLFWPIHRPDGDLHRRVWWYVASGVFLAFVAAVILLPSEIIGRINAASTMIVAGTTAALAVFAGVTLWRERKHGAERREEADAEIAIHAHLLKRMVDKTLEEPWPGKNLEQMEQHARLIQKGYPAFIEHVGAMGILAAKASDDARKAAYNAFDTFYRVFGRINDVEDDRFDEEEARRQMDQAQYEFKDCRDELNGLVPRELRAPIKLRGSPPTEPMHAATGSLKYK